MRKTWYFTKWTRRTRAWQLALILGLAFTGTVVFAATPDWLRQAAQALLPSYPDDTDAVVLLDERLTTVSPAGEVRTTYRKVYKILRPEGRNKGTLYVYFDSETQLTFLKAWSITSQTGEYEVKEGDAIETAVLSEGLYADTRFKVLQIPAAQPGSVIGYEYQQRQRPFVLQAVWSFQDEIPVRRARFSLELPPNWSYTAHWRNRAAVSPQQSGTNRWTWELTDIEPVRSEALGLKRKDRPAAFAGRSESPVFWLLLRSGYCSCLHKRVSYPTRVLPKHRRPVTQQKTIRESGRKMG